MRIVKGVDLDALPSMFENAVPGRTLILDGDGPAYWVAATVKRLDTAIRRFQQDVLAQMFLARCETARIHLTASGSLKTGRFDLIPHRPYQGVRKGKDKPSLLEPLREALQHRENWLEEFEFVRLHRELEADDGMMHCAYQLGEAGVVWSDDKDLRMTPYPYFEKATAEVRPGEEFGHLRMEYTPSGTPKLLGQGPLFFWAQMLMGDSADNVEGLHRLRGKPCGPAGALKELENVTSITEAANTVLDAYRTEDQNPLPEGWCLWLLRHPADNFYAYLTELELSPENRAFIGECLGRQWFKTRDED